MINTTPVCAIEEGIVPCPEGWNFRCRLLGARWGHAEGKIQEAAALGTWYIGFGHSLRIAANFRKGTLVMLRWESPEVGHG